MTIREAMNQKLTRVRLPNWLADTHLEFHVTAEGSYGPWVMLHDDISMPGKPTPILITQLLNDPETEYVAWPPSAPKWKP